MDEAAVEDGVAGVAFEDVAADAELLLEPVVAAAAVEAEIGDDVLQHVVASVAVHGMVVGFVVVEHWSAGLEVSDFVSEFVGLEDAAAGQEHEVAVQVPEFVVAAGDIAAGVVFEALVG